MAQQARKKMGVLLREAGIITQDQFANALLLQKEKNQRLGKILIELGYITEDQVAETLSRGLSLPLIDCGNAAPSEETLRLVSRETAEKRLVFPVEIRGRKLVVAMADPLDWRTIDELSFSAGRNIIVGVAAEASILKAIERHYVSSNDILQFVKDVPLNEKVEFLREITSDESADGKTKPDLTVSSDIMDDAPIIKFVTMVLVDAAKSRVSDVHFEPGEKDVQVRFRIDGELKVVIRYPIHLHMAVVTRIKIISNLDITNRRLPQDGRTLLRMEKKNIDIRISTLPSVVGEKVVLRLLDHSAGLVPLAKLGVREESLKILLSMIGLPQGMILVTGPTGSGKTTSLYSMLSHLQSETKNIITIEDPVEYRIGGVTQVGINDSIGLSFSTVLRSVLRQDPDIIMVGEIRDLDTAEIATRAALTGHLVLSTLHTNDTVATITRLVDIGLEPYLIASAVTGIVAQRLVRKICPKCGISVNAAEDVKKQGLPPLPKARRGKGCPSCKFTGFFGRIGIYEILPLNQELRRLISKEAEESVIRDAARRAGMITLFDDAWEKVVQGITTVDEVTAKIPFHRPAESDRPREAARRAVLIGLSPKDGRIAGELLKREGFKVDEAPTKEIAKKFLSLPPDLLIVFADEGLPAFLEMLGKYPRFAKVPVILLAETVTDPLVETASRWRVHGILPKPIRPESFLSIVRKPRRHIKPPSENLPPEAPGTLPAD